MKNLYWRPLLLACQFLTSLPIQGRDQIEDADVGRSFLWYPLVGLLIGGLLWGFSQLAAAVLPTLLSATLVVTLWALITGALHLDGLADSADAWIGGFGNRARTLEIMKDPTCGPVGVVTLVMLLLIKVAAIHQLLQMSSGAGLILVPVVGRLGVIVLFLTTAYVRAGGLGEALANHFSRSGAWRVVAVTAVLLILVAPVSGSCALLVCAAVFWLMRRQMLARLAGCTGDTAGALIEILEVSALITLAALA